MGNEKQPFVVTPTVNNVDLVMEIDTGALLSLISESTYRESWPAQSTPNLEPTNVQLKMYTGKKIGVLGKLKVRVDINHQSEELNLLVVESNSPSLLGVDWLAKLKLDWKKVHQVKELTALQEVLESHKVVFKDELGYLEQNCTSSSMPSLNFVELRLYH